MTLRRGATTCPHLVKHRTTGLPHRVRQVCSSAALKLQILAKHKHMPDSIQYCWHSAVVNRAAVALSFVNTPSFPLPLTAIRTGTNAKNLAVHKLDSSEAVPSAVLLSSQALELGPCRPCQPASCRCGCDSCCCCCRGPCSSREAALQPDRTGATCSERSVLGCTCLRRLPACLIDHRAAFNLRRTVKDKMLQVRPKLRLLHLRTVPGVPACRYQQHLGHGPPVVLSPPGITTAAQVCPGRRSQAPEAMLFQANTCLNAAHSASVTNFWI